MIVMIIAVVSVYVCFLFIFLPAKICGWIIQPCYI